MGKPYISVIITAYDRKKYLLGAVRSALDQMLSKDLYEVIVVKNFRDEGIDRQLEKWGVVDLYSDDVSQGGKFVTRSGWQGVTSYPSWRMTTSSCPKSSSGFTRPSGMASTITTTAGWW